MPRRRSTRVHTIKSTLESRLESGAYEPGDAFFSARALAGRYGISYQTAHRLLAELVDEGRLVRQRGSGTFLPGVKRRLTTAALLFHPRARRAGSFGANLLALLRARLDRHHLPYRLHFTDSPVDLPAAHYPVIWENPGVVATLGRTRRYGLLLNDSPPAGIAAGYIDAVTTDNVTGGQCAAELLEPVAGRGRVVVIAGPREDFRSRQRVEGFLSLLPRARVTWAASWNDDAGRAAGRRLPRDTAACFCANDRLAAGLLAGLEGRKSPRPEPAVVGFDDAPLAEALGLTTIGIPWESLVGGALDVIKKRLAGDTTTARQQLFAPRPIRRKP